MKKTDATTTFAHYAPREIHAVIHYGVPRPGERCLWTAERSQDQFNKKMNYFFDSLIKEMWKR